MDKDFQAELIKAIEAKSNFIMENRERLVEAFLAQHGLYPDEAVLVEKQNPDGSVSVWVKKKGE